MADIIKSYNDVHRRNVDMLDGTYAEVVSAISNNIKTKFREAFEVYDPVNGGRWQEVKASGDLIFLDGNAVAASYLVISKDPLSAGTESSITSIGTVGMPIEASAGLHMSQRTLGQEFAVEMVDTGAPLPDVADLAISAISQATTVLTVDTVTPHGLVVGKSIGIRDCSNLLANYPALVVASVPSPTQFTATAGPGGTIASQTITNPAGAKGFVFFRERLGRARNGIAEIFEQPTATQASLYIRSEAGDALPSGTVAGNHSVTVATTASVQLVNSAYQYAFASTSEYRLLVQADRTQWADSAVDALTQTTSRLLRTQVCPDPSETYKVRVRATNNKSLTVPVAQIVSAVKSGTTTATINTDRPHGLVANDPVVIYGIRAQGAAEFPNLATATAVASVTSPTQFTIVIGTAGTVTSYGGYVAKVQGGNLMSALGAVAQVAQSATLSTLADGTRQLVLVGSANWAAPATTIGDLVELVGVRDNTTGATLNVDGPWKIANVATTNLTLVLPYADQRVLPADFASTNCGGGVIKRTDLRISFFRVFDYERERVELLARPSGDLAAGVPVVLQGGTLSSGTVAAAGTVAVDSAIGNPVTAGLRASNANIAAMSATGDSVAWLGTMIGAGIVKPYALPEAEWSFTSALTATTDVAVQTAAGAGLKRHATLLQATNTGATANDVLLRDGTTTRIQVTVPAGQSVYLPLPTGIPTTANTALNVALGAAGTVRVNVLGYTAP